MIKPLKKVYIVKGTFSRPGIENPDKKEYCYHELLIVADNASEALMGTSEYMSKYLEEKECKGFDEITVTQSHTTWFMVV